MRQALLVLIVLVGGAAVYGYLAAPINPVPWELTPNQGLQGPFAENRRLADITRLLAGVGEGPEAIACAADGTRYTGFKDGRIVRFNAAGEHAEFARTGGRPLGMKVQHDGKLIVADGILGLLSIDADGVVTMLADSVDGERMLFVDDLDIARDGTIWFSDASQRHDYHHSVFDFLEGRPTGRLLSYSPASGQVQVHLDGLFFANGVALGPDEAYVLVNETGTGRVHRLWLKGDKSGQSDIFVEGLPGMPDNVTFNGEDTFWLAMPSLRGQAEQMADKPLLRRYLSLLPTQLLAANADNYSFVVGLDLQGKIVTNLQDADRGFIDITSAVECAGGLYLGSLTMPSVGRFALQ